MSGARSITMDRDRVWLLVFAGYYLFHVIYRLALGGALGLDESQTILNAQEFALGYGPQPPLYAWLQRLVFLVFGDNLFSMTLFKNLLLFASVLGVYGVMRRYGSAHMAGLSASGLILLHQFSWESQRDLSHSVIAVFFSIWTVVVMARLLRRPDLVSFLLLGAVVGLGCLSKYNYAIFVGALLLAALSLPDIRQTLFRWPLALSAVLAVLIVTPHGLWVQSHMAKALRSSHKFEMDSGFSLATALSGLTAELVAIMSFGLLLTVVSGVIYLRYPRGEGEADAKHPLPPILRLVVRAMWIGLALIAVAVLVSGATAVKDRWLTPVLIWLAPVIIFALYQRISDIGRRRLLQVYGAMALLVVIGLPVHIYEPNSRRAVPMATVAEDLVAPLPADAPIYATSWLAGNLSYFADRPVRRAEDAEPAGETGTPRYFVWAGDDPAEARRYARTNGDLGFRRTDIETVRVPYPFQGGAEYALSVVKMTPASPSEN